MGNENWRKEVSYNEDELIIENSENPFVIRIRDGELWIDNLYTGKSPFVRKELGTLMINSKENKHKREFPDCYDKYKVVKILGIGECENCNYKG